VLSVVDNIVEDPGQTKQSLMCRANLGAISSRILGTFTAFTQQQTLKGAPSP
jgi:hypothetical protein